MVIHGTFFSNKRGSSNPIIELTGVRARARLNVFFASVPVGIGGGFSRASDMNEKSLVLMNGGYMSLGAA
jgi:hypothetical protein